LQLDTGAVVVESLLICSPLALSRGTFWLGYLKQSIQKGAIPRGFDFTVEIVFAELVK
jgi:hypothetical protein